MNDYVYRWRPEAPGRRLPPYDAERRRARGQRLALAIMFLAGFVAGVFICRVVG